MKAYISTKFYVAILFTITLVYNLGCTYNKADQLIKQEAPNSTTDLVAVKATTPLLIDGKIDQQWNNATHLKFDPRVPDPGNGLFSGYIDDKFFVSLRAMYDDKNIYFLAEYADDSKSVNVSPWYFNPKTKLWAQEGTSKVIDANGIMTRNGFGEDKIAMLWNIDNSTPKFVTQTCYASCHVFTPYTDFSVTPAVVRSNANAGNHYTNGANEKIDMWWGRLGRDAVLGKMDDNYQDWAGGPNITNLTGGNANGRHVDDLVVTGTSSTWPNRPTYSTAKPQGSITNRQSLKLDGTGASVNVPIWLIPNNKDYHYIAPNDTLPGGLAVKINKVSSTGILYFDGGIVDPNVDGEFLRIGDEIHGGVGPKSIPSYITSPYLGGRNDIDFAAVHTGSGWVIEFKRALKTADVLKQDVDFTGLANHPFGFAVWDRSNNQHAIKSDLLLKFKK
jgi:Ethylbenzene dehydrogenase